MNTNDELKNENHTNANNELSDFYCPCCGLDTPQLFEGYCKPCLEEKQYQLDTHNNQYDRWGRLTYEQRNAEIIIAKYTTLVKRINHSIPKPILDIFVSRCYPIINLKL